MIERQTQHSAGLGSNQPSERMVLLPSKQPSPTICALETWFHRCSQIRLTTGEMFRPSRLLIQPITLTREQVHLIFHSKRVREWSRSPPLPFWITLCPRDLLIFNWKSLASTADSITSSTFGMTKTP